VKRSKDFWRSLSKSERSELVGLERGANRCHSSSYLPDDCVECGYCGGGSLSGLCNGCSSRLEELLKKTRTRV
jgi:hypothetical protein